MDAIKVLKLDLLSVRPYFTIKNLIILVGMGTLYGALSKNPVTVLSIVQMFAMLFSVYPFMVGEESGIDPLYKLFGIDLKDVVKGRYLLAALFVLAMLIIGMVLALIVAIIWSMPDAYQGLLLGSPIVGLITSAIIFLQYPIFFKYGYKKGKTLVVIPFLLIGIVVVISAFWGKQLKVILQLFMMNKFIGIMLLLVMWAIISFGSLQISRKAYSGRDF